MKTEFTDVSATQKTITIEIPIDVVAAEINRVAKGYTKQARIPGFRPGKVPTTLVKQRFKEQILNDVAHGLIPRAVDEALQERGIEPVDTPNIKDVALEEGQPLTFTAAIETVPPFDVGDLSTIEATRRPSVVTDEAVEKTLTSCASAARSSSRSKTAASPTATRWCSTSSARIPRASPIATRTSASSSAPPRIHRDSTPNSLACGPAIRRPSRPTFPRTTRSRRWPTPTSSTR